MSVHVKRAPGQPATKRKIGVGAGIPAGLTAAVDAIAERAVGAASDAASSAQAAANAAAVASQTPASAAAGMLQSYRDLGTGSLDVAILGDTSWARQWSKDYGAQLDPSLSRTYRTWTGSSWSTVQDSAGTGGTPATGGTYAQDGFSGSGDVVGSTPDTQGPAWTGKAGVWTRTNGAATASVNGAFQTQAPAGDVTLTANLNVTTSAAAAQQSWRFFVQSPDVTATSANGVWGYLTISTSGAVTAGLVKTISGTTTTIATCATTGITANTSGAQAVTLTVSMSGLNASMTLTGPGGQQNTATGTITSADQSTLGRYVGVLATSTTNSGLALDRIDVATPYNAGSPAPGITWHVHPGLTTTDLASAYPASPSIEVAIIAATQEQATPVIAELRKNHPAVAILVTTGADVPALTMPVDPSVTGRVGTLEAQTAALVSVKRSPLEMLRALKGIGDGLVRIGVISDSTANDPTDWVRVWQQKWGANLNARVNRTYYAWTDSSSSWSSATVDNAGAAPDTGVQVDDTFTRTGELVGSSPDTGPAWAGTTGTWTADGSKLTAGSTFGYLNVNMGSPDQTFQADLAVTTTAPTAAQSFRLYIGAKGAGSGVYVILFLSTAGALTAQLYKAFPTIGAMGSAVPVAGVTTGSSTPQNVSVTLTNSIQNVTCTITTNGQTTTLTGQITEAESSSRGHLAYMFGGGAGGQYFATVDHVHVKTAAADNPPPTPTLTIWNGATPGAGLSWWNATKRAQVFGGKTLDVILISLGHNQQTQTPDSFVAGMSSLVAAVQAEHPEASILVSSQNPQQSPATGIAAHRARQAALRVWAAANGFDYIPAFEAFAARPDGGTGVVNTTDGVHPTTPPAGTTTGDYGAIVWADTMTSTIG